MIRQTIPFINDTVKKAIFKTVGSAKNWDMYQFWLSSPLGQNAAEKKN